MPEETQNTEAAPAQPAPQLESLPAVPVKATEAKPNSMPMMMILGVVILLVVVLGAGAAAWYFVSQGSMSGSQNTATLLSDPKNIVNDANSTVKTYVKDLDITKLEALSKDPSSAYSQMYVNMKDEAYDFDMNVNVDGKTGTTTPTKYVAKVNLAGKVVTVNKKASLDGKFDVNISASGFTFAMKGDFRLVGEKFYVKVIEGGELFTLPTNWIGIDLKDAAAQAGGSTSEMTAEDKAELEGVISKLKSFQGDLMINTKEVANRTVKGESLKCVQTEINPAIATIYADEKELANAQKAFESLTPYTICANGETKPVFYSIGVESAEGDTTGTVGVEMVVTKLASLPTIEAPAASEVTDLGETGIN